LACEKLRQSDSLDPAPGTQLNLAECEAQRGLLATAWELFRAVEQKLTNSDPRYSIAKHRREALEAQLPKLLLALAPGAPTSTIARDGSATMGAAVFGVALPLDPGVHSLLVSAPGRAERKFDVTLVAGQTTTLAIEPGPPLPVALPASGVPLQQAAVAEKHPSDEPESSSKTFGYVVGGIGLGGLVVGGVFGGLTLQAKSTNQHGCDPATRQCSAEAKDAAGSGQTYGIITTAGLATALVGLGLGTYFLVKGSSHSNQTAIQTQVTATGASVAFARSW
jgi:hypothetical protein